MNKKILILTVFFITIGISTKFASAVVVNNSRSAMAPISIARGEINIDEDNARTAKRVVSANTDLNSRAATNKKTVIRTATVDEKTDSAVRSTKSNVRPNAGRAATLNTSRSASVARSGTKPMVSNSLRTARATAVFNDVSKIGGGYSQCRESYNTCMDQFCANANDTYRRCYCSDKITQFRETEAALDQAKVLLQQFSDNNLNAVDKTADEVGALYSATVGERAIKNDTSAAASVLSEIGDLLSGKKRAKEEEDTIQDFTLGIENAWSNDQDIAGGMFGKETTDLSTLEGTKLYNEANKQCGDLMGDTCGSEAIVNMTKSAYNILIAQDCTIYEKDINAKKATVEKTVREAEKVLRDARLEEYRTHNSADINQCITKIKDELFKDTACGENYARCMDYTGMYINATTGEPIYSAHLQDLPTLIQLDDANGDVLRANKKFDDFLDDKKMFAEKALDTCRDKADDVWTEFKRSALIEIAQAQDEKIEEVKDSCVSIMGECYDAQSGALADFDNTTSQYSAALGARASRAMCADKVAACAAVYAGPDDPVCEFDSKTGKLKNTQCGLSALLAFVNTVDTVKISEGCETALQSYATKLCTPSSGDYEYPYACRLFLNGNKSTAGTLAYDLDAQADVYCRAGADNTDTTISEDAIETTITNLINKIEVDLAYQLETICEGETINGIWLEKDDSDATADGSVKETAFYDQVYAGNDTNNAAANSWGFCIQNTIKYQCDAQNEATGAKGYATYNATQKKCDFTQDWYKIVAEKAGGYCEDNQCYLPQ